ncbi:unnamed protein product [Diamesa hyperborea]
MVVCTPSKIGENVGGWLKEITKIDYFGSVSEVQVPMLCQKIIATNASAQLQCFVCENCETIPDNLVAQQCNTIVVTTTTIPPPSSTTASDELTPQTPPTGPTPTTVPGNNIPTNPAPPILTTSTAGPVVTPSTAPVTGPTNPPPIIPTNAPVVVLPELNPSPTPIPIPNPIPNPVPTPEDPFNPELTPRPNDIPIPRYRRNVEVAPAASQFSCFTLRSQFNATTVITNRGCVRNGGDTAQTCQSANTNIVQDSSSAQLRCFQCTDCGNFNRQDSLPVPCGGASPNMTTTVMTDPVTSPTPPGNVPVTPATNSETIVGYVEATQSVWNCFYLTRVVGDREIRDRGCVVRGTNDATTCTAANQGVAPRECTLCSDSECNSSASIVASIVLIFASVFVAMRLQ